MFARTGEQKETLTSCDSHAASRAAARPQGVQARRVNAAVADRWIILSTGMSAGSDLTRVLDAAARGDVHAASHLLPLVYEELRTLAAQRIAQERPGRTLQATALVHEAYVRLVGAGANPPQQFSGRAHFFGAAAEAMRRILVEAARRRDRVKRGGGLSREELDASRLEAPAEASEVADDLVELDAALDRLARQDAQAAELVKLRFFAGLTIPQSAEMLGVSPRKADLLWSFARAWLRRELAGCSLPRGGP